MKQYNNLTIVILFVILSFLALFGVNVIASEAQYHTVLGEAWRSRLNLKIPHRIASAVEPPCNDINKFGIHILEPSDLAKAQELVNSSGGDWGWVTMVIRDDDMNHDKWQGFMDECRTRHLIPLVRIATHLEGQNWAKPKIADAQNWANFLDGLNWPVSDQFVIIFNEPNHSKEFGGEINPKEYAKILSEFIQKFQISNSRPPGFARQSGQVKFQILNAGLDLAAGNTKTTMDSYDFMRQIDQQVPGIFEKLDGWASHSYPNHGFLGKPWDNGKYSIRGYEWELGVLKNDFKVKKDLPVFITETGWPILRSGKLEVRSGKRYYDERTIEGYIKYAFENVWLKDDKIKAITPFVLNYPEDLFDEFSWLDKDGKPHHQFETIKTLKKISWVPKQDFKADVVSIVLPPFLPVNTQYQGKITLKNTGQSIWGEYDDTISNKMDSSGLIVSNLFLEEGEKIKPGEKRIFDFTLKSTEKFGEMNFGWENIGNYKIKVFPSSTLTSIKYNLWQKVILKIKSFFNQG